MPLNDHRWGRHPDRDKPAPAEPQSGVGKDEEGREKSARDLEAEWRSFNELLEAFFGRGKDPGSGKDSGKEKRPGLRWNRRVAVYLALTIIFAVGAYLGGGLYTLEPGQAAAVYESGHFKRIVGPGAHWRKPWPFGSVRVVDTKTVHRQELRFIGGGEPPLATADAAAVAARATIEWQVPKADVRNYLEKVVNPAQEAEAALRSAVRRLFADMTVRDALAGRAGILASRLIPILQSELEGLGMHVVDVSVTGASVPDDGGSGAGRRIEAEKALASEVRKARAWAESALAVSADTAARILAAAESGSARVKNAAEADSAAVAWIASRGAGESEMKDQLERAWTSALAAAVPSEGALPGATLEEIMAVIDGLAPQVTGKEGGEQGRAVTESQVRVARRRLGGANASDRIAGAASDAPIDRPEALRLRLRDGRDR